MRDETVARNYAETLFELARRHEGIEAYHDALGTVARLLDESPDIRLFLETPRIESKRKKDVLKRVFADRVPKPFLNFLLVVVDKRRQRLLRAISAEFHEIVDEHLNRAHIQVTAARPLSDDTVERIGRAFSRVLDKEAVPHVRVNPAILGGVVVRTGDTIYDGSLRRRVEGMRRALLSAELPEPDEPGLEDAAE